MPCKSNRPALASQVPREIATGGSGKTLELPGLVDEAKPFIHQFLGVSWASLNFPDLP